MESFSRLCWLMLVGLLISEQVVGRATLYIKLDRFENEEGLAANGHCCDGRWGLCQGDGCDYIFTFCLDRNTHGAEDFTTDSCFYGKKSCREIPNHTNLQFLSHFGGLDNPMEFRFEDFNGEKMALTIQVEDVDDWSDNDHVDNLMQRDIVPSASWQQLNVTSQSGHTRMIGSFRIECDGPCGNACPPPSAGQYYTCVDGIKVCSAGWEGDNCDVKSKKTTKATTAIKTTPSTTSTTTRAGPDNSGFPHLDQEVPWDEDAENNDCDRIAMNGYRYQDGVYAIKPGNAQPFDVYCDMGSRGWTVIQRRQSQIVDFNRSWQQYQEGFGDLGWNTNYWIGLENLYQLTNQRTYKLKIVMRLANLEFRFANYERFLITSEDDGYRIYVDEYAGNAGDALSPHNGAAFSAADHDVDSSSRNCGRVLKSGWWFTDCFTANLNGVYPVDYSGWPPCDAKNRCINWSTIPNYGTYSLVQVEMSIFPNP